MEEVVYQPNLRQLLFTTEAVDNIDMINLDDKYPDALAEFKYERLVVDKTNMKLCAMTIDQWHEENTNNRRSCWIDRKPRWQGQKYPGSFIEHAIRKHGDAHATGHLHQ